MTAGASLLDLIGERTSSERAPAVRAFAEAFLRRLSADGADGALAPDAPLRRDRRRLRVRLRARRASRSRCAPSRRRSSEHGYEPLGSVVETNTEDWPFLVDSVSAALRGARARDPPRRCTRSSASSATPTARSRRCCTRARPSRRESVMHFDLDRRLDARAARGARGRRCARCSPTSAPRSSDFPAMTDRRAADDPARGRGGGALRPTTRSTRPSTSSSGCCATTSSSSARASTRFRDGRDLGRARLGARHPRRRGRSTYAKPVPVDSLPPACARGRSRATC